MAIALDSTSSGQTTGGSPTSTTVSHTVVSNTSGIIVVCVANVDPSIVSGVTYNGSAMTLVIERNDADYRNCSIWRLLAPSTGTHDIVVTHSASNTVKVFGAAFTDVDQVTPIGATAGATNTTGAVSSVITTTQDNSVIISVVSKTNATSLGTPGTDQINIASAMEANSHQSGATYEPKATAGADTQGWSGTNGWSIVSLELKEDLVVTTSTTSSTTTSSTTSSTSSTTSSSTTSSTTTSNSSTSTTSSTSSTTTSNSSTSTTSSTSSTTSSTSSTSSTTSTSSSSTSSSTSSTSTSTSTTTSPPYMIPEMELKQWNPILKTKNWKPILTGKKDWRK